MLTHPSWLYFRSDSSIYAHWYGRLATNQQVVLLLPCLGTRYIFVNLPSTTLKALPFAVRKLNPAECVTSEKTCISIKTQKKNLQKAHTFQRTCTPL